MLMELIAAGTLYAQVAPLVPPAVRPPVEILAPPPPPTVEALRPVKKPALFGWGQRGEIRGGIYQPFIIAAGLSMVFADPYHLGEIIGLAEDALEYKAGLGLAAGSLFSLPLYGGADLYFKEGSFFGFDPFVGAGLNLNFGGLGYQFYGGLLVDLGREEKTAFLIGYNSYRIEGARFAEGMFISVFQPLKL